MTALLEARNATKTFGGGVFRRRQGTVALDDFSFRIDADPPTITAVVGESGSGKTTLVRLLLGLAAPTSGEVLYRGTPLQALSGEERRRFLRDVQVIFQDPYEVYNPFYKVDHVLAGPIRKFGLAPAGEKTRTLMEETLNAVGLRPDETLGRYPHQLSGGQRQRIMVARALLLQPRLIIADEPVSMVDASLRATILESLRQLHLRFGISLLYITHDLTTAYQIAQNIIVMYRGEVAEAGDVDLAVKQPLHPYTQLLIQSIPLPDPGHRWQTNGDAPAALPAAEVPPVPTAPPVAPTPVLGAASASLGAAAAPSPAAATGPVAGPPPGCKFADRCPHVMDVCRTVVPPLFRTDERRAAACFLYRDRPELPAADLNRVLAVPPPLLHEANLASNVGSIAPESGQNQPDYVARNARES